MFPKSGNKIDVKLRQETKALECCVCGQRPGQDFNPIDPSHVKTFGSGGPDTDWNLVPHCRRCHREWEDTAHADFFRKHPRFLHVLGSEGWEWDGHRLTHPKLRGE